MGTEHSEDGDPLAWGDAGGVNLMERRGLRITEDEVGVIFKDLFEVEF